MIEICLHGEELGGEQLVFSEDFVVDFSIERLIYTPLVSGGHNMRMYAHLYSKEIINLSSFIVICGLSYPLSFMHIDYLLDD
jgi:hypothetical protein